MLKEWRPVIRNVVIFLILLILITVVIALLIFPDKEDDLILNLFSEMMGTALSVFCIDQLLKIREEIHQLPTRYFWYTRLFDIVEELLINTLPKQYYQHSKKTYHYKRANLFVTPRIEKTSEIHFESLGSEVLEALDMNSYSNLASQLIRSEKTVNNVIERSLPYFQERELMLILNFDQSLEHLIDMELNLENEDSRQDFAVAMSIAIKHAVKIDLWLREIIDHNFTLLN